jgi:hypothetical protein
MGFGGVIFLTLGGYLADLTGGCPFLIYLLAWLILPLILLVLPEPSANSSTQSSEAVGLRVSSLAAAAYDLQYCAGHSNCVLHDSGADSFLSSATH